MSFASVCFIGTGLVNGYYMLNALDQVLIYFARRCANEDIQRLYSFVIEMREMHNVLLEITEDNYLKLLAWKMDADSSESNNLSHLMHSIFDERLNDREYARLQRDINIEKLIVRDRSHLQLREYTVMKSYFDQYADDQKRLHPGLRRRLNCGFFPNKYESEQDVEAAMTVTKIQGSFGV